MTDSPADELVIQLDRFLKIMNLVESGGQAKLMIQGGFVDVNGETETRRKRKLRHGDIVTFEQTTLRVEFDDEP